MEVKMKVKGVVKFTLTDIKTGKTIVKTYENIFVNTGLNALARGVINKALYTNEGIITYGAVGTGTNVPDANDSKLQTETARKLVASSSASGAVSEIYFFYSADEGVGDLKEFGCFGELATAVADSGTLFNRVVIDISKTSGQTLTIQYSITFASA